jgi:hypothetical protein
VGAIAIREDAVKHWAAVLAQGEPGDSASGFAGSSRRRALEFLVSSNWLIGEAAERGVGVSDGQVERALNREEETSLGGAKEFNEALEAGGKTIADAKLEVRVKLARARIVQMLAGSEVAIAQPQIVAYYKAHIERYRIPEERAVDLLERIPSRPVAESLKVRIQSRPLMRRAYQHEMLMRPPAFDGGSQKGVLVRAVFMAEPGEIGGPIFLNRGYALFVVRRIVPASVKPLARVSEAIGQHLAARRAGLRTTKFFRTYHVRWVASTSCATHLVVQQCREYPGHVAEVDPFSSG